MPNKHWQDKYAAGDWKQLLTHLDPNAEHDFQVWAKTNDVPVTPDYDMRGFFKALAQHDASAKTAVNPNDHQLHFPDTYKTPLHQSFSGESRFANPNLPGPKWNTQDQLVESNGHVVYDEQAKHPDVAKAVIDALTRKQGNKQ